MANEFNAAWLPAAAIAPGWNEAIAKCVSWIRSEAATAGHGEAILVSDAFNTYRNHPLSRFVRGKTYFTPRSSRPDPDRGRAVLAFVPTAKALEFASRTAQGGSLCVIEHSAPPALRGWARIVGAVDLLTDSVTPPYEAEIAKTLSWLVQCGNNGYAPAIDKRDAKRFLGDLIAAGVPSEEIPAALGALGIYAEGQQAIADMIKKLPPATDPPAAEWNSSLSGEPNVGPAGETAGRNPRHVRAPADSLSEGSD